MKYGLHFAKVATGELAFMRGYMCAVKPRQMSEFTTKNAHTQKNEYFLLKMIDSSIKIYGYETSIYLEYQKR